MEMIYVESGTFTMGSPVLEEGRNDNETQHQVTLTKGYWLGKYEVTQAQWQSVMGDNPSIYGGETFSVNNVSWKDCQSFIGKINSQRNYRARLPTEAEWEYACRAGTTGAYSGTGVLDDMGWYYAPGILGGFHPVGQKRANAWGFYDMHGNVWEWCNDCYGVYDGDVVDPRGGKSSEDRVLRGGSGRSYMPYCRSAYRYRNNPDYHDDDCGFRLACSE